MPRKANQAVTLGPARTPPASGVQINHNPATGSTTITGSLGEIRRTLGAFGGEGGGGNAPLPTQTIDTGTGNPTPARKRAPMSEATKKKLRLAAKARKAAAGTQKKRPERAMTA